MAPTQMISTEDSFPDFLAAHIWIPVLAISAAILVVITIMLCVWKCRNKVRYDYSLLKADLALPQKLEMERKLQYDTMRETALLHCQFYLRSSGIYTPVEHLSEIGCRVGKHWFLVRDTRSKVDKLLTMVHRGHQFLLPFTSATRTTLLNILQNIQHPYIYPICDIDLLLEQDRIVLILPYNSQGSLKDVIYHAHCMDTWSSKYYVVGTGLPPHLVARYGRQILEALIFLQKSGFPPIGHLHSGNVILQNNTCRLSGYESDLIGLSPKLYGMTTKLLRDDKAAIEVVSFGHLLYEMTMGNEMEVTIPQARHFETIPHQDIRQCLEFIFRSTADRFHSLEEICTHPFFNVMSSTELDVFKRRAARFTKNEKVLLKAVRRGKAPSVKKLTASPAPNTTHPAPAKRNAYRPSADNKEHSGRFQLPPPMYLRIKETSSKTLPQQQQTTATTPRQQQQQHQQQPTTLAGPGPQTLLPGPYKPVVPVRPRAASAPTQARPTTSQAQTKAERMAVLHQLRSGTTLTAFQPPL